MKTLNSDDDNTEEETELLTLNQQSNWSSVALLFIRHKQQATMKMLQCSVSVTLFISYITIFYSNLYSYSWSVF